MHSISAADDHAVEYIQVLQVSGHGPVTPVSSYQSVKCQDIISFTGVETFRVLLITKLFPVKAHVLYKDLIYNGIY